MFVELHIIQNFPPSNLNRDDLGQPKDSDFGGYRRARISSQCLKRSVRYAGRNVSTGVRPVFERLTQVPLGARTSYMAEALKGKLMAVGKSEGESLQVAVEFARVFSSKKGKMKEKKPDQTSVLLYIAEGELEQISLQILAMDWTQLLADIHTASSSKRKAGARDEDEEKLAAKSPLKKVADDFARSIEGRTSAPDIALFGRMLADRPLTDIDAACQVAHAISTHSIGTRTPIDYYTAVDDLKTEPGAGFLDVAYFNSACFYRYARIDFEQLKKNLGADEEMAIRSVKAFLYASEAAIPSGKKNAFAPECRPSFMLAVVRESESDGWSLVNAFQRPVDVRNRGEEDLVLASVKRLEKRFKHLVDFYESDPEVGNQEEIVKTVKTIAVALPDGTVEAEQLDQYFQDSVHNMRSWVAVVCDALHKEG